MVQQNFTLLPFETAPAADLQINGLAERSNHQLLIHFALTGALDRIVLAQPSGRALRKDRLWEQTCFECFVGTEQASSYWEYNFSPAGHWNVYRFEDYRSGMRPEPAYDFMTLETDGDPECLTVRCLIDLAAIALSRTPIRVGLSAIIQTRDKQFSHWALAHTGPGPDFHRHDAFILSF